MKRSIMIFIACVAIIIIPLSTRSAGPSRHDSYFWNRLNQSQKVFLITGFYDGLLMGLGPEKKKLFQPIFRNTSVGDVVNGLNEFYKRHLNCNISVSNAALIVNMEKSGYSEYADCVNEALIIRNMELQNLKMWECNRLPAPMKLDLLRN